MPRGAKYGAHLPPSACLTLPNTTLSTSAPATLQEQWVEGSTGGWRKGEALLLRSRHGPARTALPAEPAHVPGYHSPKLASTLSW